MDKIKRMQDLITALNKASDAYYGGQDETISNFEWDMMFDELARLEEETGQVLPNSPTHDVSSSKADSEDVSGVKEPHEFPALSLAKTKSVEELQKWASDKSVWLSWKLDGLTLVLTYDNGSLTKILTRGNGVSGTNITYFKNVIKGIPSKIQYKGHLVIRGEAAISYTDFDIINDLIDTEEKYANPRNLAAGTLALDHSKKDIVKSRNVTFIAFSLIHIDEDMNFWGNRMDYLDKLGFITVEREQTDASGLPDAVEKWTRNVETRKIDYPVDGLVLCYDDNVYASTGSVTGHHATRAGLAFKWQDEMAETTLKYIEWSCAASVITPVAVFEPVNLEGTVVSRASLCNLSELERLGIGAEGKTRLQVIKANKIIPKCIGVAEAEGNYIIPDKCPVCHMDTVKDISESGIAVLKCSNSQCPAKDLARFVRFVSKTGMDIDGLSKQTLKLFINKGFISNFQDIFNLSVHSDEICVMEGFGEKSCANLLSAIEKSRNVNAVNFIFSLSIPLIGIDAAKKIINEIGYEGFIARLNSNEGFDDISGIGLEKSKAILDWYGNDRNREVFEALNGILTVVDNRSNTSADSSCNGKTFVITGSLVSFKNRTEFVEYVEARGGKVSSAVSAKTDYLVNNDVNSPSSKNRKARELGVPIISEEEFLQMFK